MSEDQTTNGGPAHDYPAEQALLGALLNWPDVIEPVTERLLTADFYRPVHGLIYATVVANWASNRPTDPISLAQQLIGERPLQQVGGLTYLHTLISHDRTPGNAVYHADLVAAASHRRQLQTTAARIAQLVADPERDPATLAIEATRLLADTATVVTTPAVNGNRWRGRIRLTPASAFQIRPVRWVWDQRVPLGEITLVAGREGVGKSSYLAWLASQITNGNLPGHWHGQPRAVLYAATEDSWEATIAPRMIAAGADLDLVYRIDTTDPDDRGIILPRDTSHLPHIAAQHNAAALMCDPIVSLVDDDISPNRPKDLRRALEPLRAACDQAGLAAIALAHFNKSTADDIGTLIAGSRAWAEVPRAIHGIVQDRDADDFTGVLSQIKNNLGRLDLPHLTYTIQTVELQTDTGEPSYVGRLHFTGESDQSAEDLLIGSRGHGDRQRALTANQLRVLTIIREHGHPMTNAEVTTAVDGEIPAATVRTILSRLVRTGHLTQPVRGTYTVAPTR
jgi:hypothetical protein